MTTEFVMPDGTHVRVHDHDADKMPDDWERLDELTDATGEGFVGTHSIQDPEEVKTKPAEAKTKPRSPKK